MKKILTAALFLAASVAPFVWGKGGPDSNRH